MLFGLVLVWQIPNVIVLRYVLLAVLSVLFGPGAVKGIVRSLSQTAPWIEALPVPFPGLTIST